MPRSRLRVLLVERDRQLLGEAVGDLGRIGRVGFVKLLEQMIDVRSIHGSHYRRSHRQERPLFPLRDINPTRIFPALTLAVIATNIIVFFGIQGTEFLTGEETDRVFEFTYENAAIACELRTGDPLDRVEIVDEVCIEERLGDALFPEKNVYLAAVVSMFLHGSFLHLLFNMWSFWVFGNNVEEAFGRAGFAILYLASGVVATAGFVILNQDSTIPLVGASGAIAGVMGSYLVLFPRHRVLTIVFFFIVAVPAVVFLGIWLLLQFQLAGMESNIAWEAHVFGFATGALLTLPLRPILLRRTAERQLDTVENPFGSLSR